MALAKLESKTCSVCHTPFQPRQRNQHACGGCRGRTQHNPPPKICVVGVTTSAGGGYPFTASFDGGKTWERGFLLLTNGYVAWPKKSNGDFLHVLPLIRRGKISQILKCQIEKIIRSPGDPRFHPMKPEETQQSSPEPTAPLESINCESCGEAVAVTTFNRTDGSTYQMGHCYRCCGAVVSRELTSPPLVRQPIRSFTMGHQDSLR